MCPDLSGVINVQEKGGNPPIGGKIHPVDVYGIIHLTHSGKNVHTAQGL